MEIFRMSRDVYGQETLEGISWELLPVAVGIGLAVIVAHLIYSLVRGKRGA
jgi:hypothetical protein